MLARKMYIVASSSRSSQTEWAWAGDALNETKSFFDGFHAAGESNSYPSRSSRVLPAGVGSDGAHR